MGLLENTGRKQMKQNILDYVISPDLIKLEYLSILLAVVIIIFLVIAIWIMMTKKI